MRRAGHSAGGVAVGLSAIAGIAAACSGGEPAVDPTIAAAQTRAYLAALAPVLVERNLSPAEDAIIEAESEAGTAIGRQAAIDAIVGGWATDPALAEAAREFVSLRLSTSGASDGVDYDLPGNLAAHTVAADLPWSAILTADYCVGADGQPTECDSGAPYAAGVLTTRAFLRSRASRFNLTRASTMMNAFACRHYPLEDAEEPRVERARLRQMFRADTPEDQEDAEMAGDFGNGFACYHCHGQFAWHAQLYVQFDREGRFRAEATGVQDPEGELGRSVDGLFASHLADPTEAASPASQILGQPVADLADAGRVLAASPQVARCASQRILAYGFGLDDDAEIDAGLLDDIAALVGDPATATFADHVVAVFTHPRVFEAASAGGLGAILEDRP